MEEQKQVIPQNDGISNHTPCINQSSPSPKGADNDEN